MSSFDPPNRQVRDLSTNLLVPVAFIRANPDGCKRNFTAARWQAFARDHAWFRTRLPPDVWLNVTIDHGYNPSPIWTILGRILASTSAASAIQIELLRAIDTLLIVGLWYVIWSTFGWRVACAGLIFWGTNYTAGNWFTAAAFLRHDWLFLSVAGVCALKRGREGLAGFCLAYAALLRVFPGFLILGVLLKMAVEMLASRSWTVSLDYRRFLVGSFVGALVLMLISVPIAGGPSVWPEFVRNTLKHHDTELRQNVGLEQALAALGLPANDLERGGAPGLESGEPWLALGVRVAIGLAFLCLLIPAVRKNDRWAAAIFGLSLLPFAVDIQNYYWSIFLVFAFLSVHRPVVLVGFALVSIAWAATGIVFSIGYDGPWPPPGGQAYYTSALYEWSSVVLIAFILWVTAIFAIGRLDSSVTARNQRIIPDTQGANLPGSMSTRHG